jgi:hypothetical protein
MPLIHDEVKQLVAMKDQNPDRDGWRSEIPALYDNELNGVCAQIRSTNKSKGFQDPYVVPERKMLLAISEVIEAHEEMRDGHAIDRIRYRQEDGKPEGFLVELADSVIRQLDLMQSIITASPDLHRTVAGVIAEKLAFNMSRPEKHGRQF